VSKTIFFAYESGHQENRDAIYRGINDYNTHQKTYQAITWEDLKVGGNILNATILKAIDHCEIFCCDLTYQNHNVLFELGYAIGKGKKLSVLLNPTVNGSKEKYSSSKVLNNIGYDEFRNGKEVLCALQQKKHISEVSINSLFNVSQHDIDTSDLLYLSSAIENQAALDLSNYIDKLDSIIIQNKSSEVEYQPLLWYITGIMKCKNILIHLLGIDKKINDSINAEYSLFAGMAYGLGKNVMLLAPKPFRAPIDYSDILVEYTDSNDCLLKTTDWIEKNLRKYNGIHPKTLKNTNTEQELNLLKLGIGYETAEEEENDLLEYFIEIETYKHATERTSCIITGRKGAGKSAIFIRLRDYLISKNNRSLNIIIKPESDELLTGVELTQLYSNEKSKRALLTATWRLVLFSSLFNEILRIISKQHATTIIEGSVEEKILNYAKGKSIGILGHFSVIEKLYQQWDKVEYGRPDVLEKIYIDQIGPIVDLVRDYFNENRFTEINILADNLDKTWDAKSDLRLQSEMILTLLEYCGSLSSEIKIQNLKSHVVLILRTDIYEFVRKSSREPDKLETRRLELDWSQYPNRLRDLIEARFRFILKIPSSESVDKIWKDYFNISKKRDPFIDISSVVVERPRDIIYFVTKLFESAINGGRLQVEEVDFNYATEVYSRFLFQNMIAETRAEFHEVSDIFSDLQSKFYSGMISYRELRNVINKYGYSSVRTDQFIDFLFNKHYLVGISKNYHEYIRNRSDLELLQKQRKYYFFKKHHVFIIFNLNRYKLSFTKFNI
jgi:hypothetical protein